MPSPSQEVSSGVGGWVSAEGVVRQYSVIAQSGGEVGQAAGWVGSR